MTIEQQRAIALAEAAMRASQDQPKVDPTTNQPQGVPAFNPGVPGYDPQTGEVQKYGKAGSAVMGAADMATMGFGDEGTAGIGYLLDKLPGGKGRNFSDVLKEVRANQQKAYDDNWKSYDAGMVGAGVAGGAALAKSGLSFLARAAAPRVGELSVPLSRLAMGGAADGAILGSINGAGNGTDAQSRAMGAGVGGAAGLGLGAAAPYAIAGVSAALKPLVAPIMARLRPQQYANAALGEGLRRSGSTADEIAARLQAAQQDNQGMFTVADAMGNAGQRMLSTAARNPNDGRQALIETLQARQMGQGERLSNTLAEGFGAPDTAAQRTASLTGQRAASADVNYPAARDSAGPVDVSGAISAANDVLTPGITRMANPGSGIADDSLEGAVRRAQSLLTDGKSQITDFNSVLRAKQDIADQISAAQRAGRNNQVRLLSQINSRLDAALEQASPGYRQANDTFRAQSRVIDAVDTGTGAASGRTRAADNIQTFGGMNPDEQNAFRAGYVDPMIAKVESSSISPTTNKARMLMTEKTGQEFPAFAVPGQADRMGTRIAREQRMFETANSALGGSKTADNLADAADMNKFDPSIMTNLLHGRPVAAVVTAVTKALNESRGLPPTVLTQLSRALMETDPTAARMLLRAGTSQNVNSATRRAALSTVLTRLNASGAGRLSGP
ncbi:hypothetical protein X730_12040 [Mesorhizobium sp. L103C565B0]|nr:hypothetical protein X730_12040 [Mesorhizobium sp. L103C565B0]